MPWITPEGSSSCRPNDGPDKAACRGGIAAPASFCSAGFILSSIKKATFNPLPAGDAFDQIVSQAADCLAKSVDDMIQGFEHFILESHSAKLLPDLLYGIHFRRVWWNVEQHDVLRNLQRTRLVPSCTIAAQQNDIVLVCPG